MALSTVSSIEAGKHSPTLAVLQAVLDVAGLEVALDVPPPELDEVHRWYLRLSVTQRLDRALGGDGRPRYRLPLPRWAQLTDLARQAEVHLHGELAVRLWLPADEPLDEAVVCAAFRRRSRRPDTPDLTVVEVCAARRGAPVVVPLLAGRVHADPPGDLALEPSLAQHRQALRAVARVLHVEAARDEAGRRVRAHRDPDHGAEREHVFHTKRFGRLPMPDPTDVRSWRLEDDAGQDAWLRRHGYPV